MERQVDQGSGRIDVPRAAGQRVTSEPPGIAFGTQRWPQNDDKPVSKEITYTNRGTAEVSLDLACRTRGPEGAEVPQAC